MPLGWVDRDLAGRGIAPTALALAADHMFGPMGLHRLEVAIRPENTKSLRVVEKLGFRFEGTRPAYMHVERRRGLQQLFAGGRQAHKQFAQKDGAPSLLHRASQPPSTARIWPCT